MPKDSVECGQPAGRRASGFWVLGPAQVGALPDPRGRAWRGPAPGLSPRALAIEAAARSAWALSRGDLPTPQGPWPTSSAAELLAGLAALCLAGEPTPWPHGAASLARARTRLAALGGSAEETALSPALQQGWQAALAWLARPEAERAVAILAACLLANGARDRPAWRLACAAAAVALAGRGGRVGG